MADVLLAIANIIKFGGNIPEYKANYDIRINSSGEQFERYIKDAFVGFSPNAYPTYGGIFSWTGNQNNPPDLMLAGGDAFEIKKIEGIKATLALNNSPPRDKLGSDDPRISKGCKEAEEWAEKDLFYVVGCIDKKEKAVKYVFFVQGTCYAASKDVYEKVPKVLAGGIMGTAKRENLEIIETKELGRVKRVDPLGITNFRVRGMWEIENPIKVFGEKIGYSPSSKFSVFGIMEKSKFESFPRSSRALLSSAHGIRISNAALPSPNNPAKTLDAIIISWRLI